MKVREIMSVNPKSCRPETNLAAAAMIMWENDCGVVPVVDDKGKVTGMITDRDICIAVASKHRLASEIPVSELISGRVYSCAPDDDLKAALKTMEEKRVRRLPVVDKAGVLQGILCMNDIVLQAEEIRGKQVPELSLEDAIRVLKAIDRHRILKPEKELQRPKTVAVA
ncbi:MAG: CBS domain-containing protein [Acidobacteria bacterium]|nr:CBS domain-containing protein [Acidobacteriota bacterium]